MQKVTLHFMSIIFIIVKCLLSIFCHGKYYIGIYRSRKVAVCLLRAQQSEREMHVAMNGTDCVSEVTSLLKELH